MPNFTYVPSKNKGDPVIEPVEGYQTPIKHVLVYAEGDAIFYTRPNTGRHERFDITNTNLSKSRHHGLPSHDRLRALSDKDIILLSHVTGLSPKDLLEIRDVEREAVPCPKEPGIQTRARLL
jgi:hypothetical protein